MLSAYIPYRDSWVPRQFAPLRPRSKVPTQVLLTPSLRHACATSRARSSSSRSFSTPSACKKATALA
jgi:hypothetical protein